MTDRGLECAKAYYQANKYFRSMYWLAETIRQVLEEKGLTCKVIGYTKKFTCETWSWVGDEGFILPRIYWGQFIEGREEFSQTNDHFVWAICFMKFNPDGLFWTPFGYFARARCKAVGGVWPSQTCSKIALAIYSSVANPSAASMFRKFPEEPWPEELLGAGGSDDLDELAVVPWPLVAIQTSDNLGPLLDKGIAALRLMDGANLRSDLDYQATYWGLQGGGLGGAGAHAVTP